MAKGIKWTVVILAVGCIAVGYLLPSCHHHGEPAVRINCAGNLKMIGLALRMYADDNSGFLPPDLRFLVSGGYAEHPKLYVCPEVGRDVPNKPTPDWEFTTDYYYAYSPGDKLESTGGERQVLASDFVGNHANFGNVLFTDGWVRGSAGSEWYTHAGMSTPPQKQK